MPKRMVEELLISVQCHSWEQVQLITLVEARGLSGQLSWPCSYHHTMWNATVSQANVERQVKFAISLLTNYTPTADTTFPLISDTFKLLCPEI